MPAYSSKEQMIEALESGKFAHLFLSGLFESLVCLINGKDERPEVAKEAGWYIVMFCLASNADGSNGEVKFDMPNHAKVMTELLNELIEGKLTIPRGTLH